jgi:acetylornithine deacetylase/succinyl-diaminopimelate desuccinylase-like protein
MQIELRSIDETVVQAFEDTLHAIIHEFTSEDVEIMLTTIGTRPGGELPPDHPLVTAAVQALESVGEKLITLEIGSTDASWPLSQGLPAICIGLTRGGGAHTLEEYIEIEPLSRGYQALRLLINSIFQNEHK